MSPVPADDRQALLVLNALPSIGPITLKRLVEGCGRQPMAVFRAGPERLQQIRGAGPQVIRAIQHWPEYFDLAAELEQMEHLGARCLTYLDPAYPALLGRVRDAPAVLYVRGSLWPLPAACVAVVGTRHPSPYGRAVARQIAGGLARAGQCVVSGLALGIDAEAHQAALAAGGHTIGVLGCGLDVVYPPSHAVLYEEVARQGALVTEFPLGRRADRSTFPMRNRIVAGLCPALAVIETDERGGAMITATFAADQGRTVFAVPGRIDQPTSRGCHKLLREGAALLTQADDILLELRTTQTTQLELTDFIPPPTVASSPLSLFPTVPEADSAKVARPARPNGGASPGAFVAAAPPPDLEPDEKTVLTALQARHPQHPDELAEATGLAAHAVAAAVMMLELHRLVAKRLDGGYDVV